MSNNDLAIINENIININEKERTKNKKSLQRFSSEVSQVSQIKEVIRTGNVKPDGIKKCKENPFLPSIIFKNYYKLYFK